MCNLEVSLSFVPSVFQDTVFELKKKKQWKLKASDGVYSVTFPGEVRLFVYLYVSVLLRITSL